MTDDVKKFVNTLEALIAEVPYAESEPQLRSYSGRGMYGTRCAAVTVDHFSEVALILYYLGRADEFGGFERYIDSAATDQMGLGLVLYFTAAKLDDNDQLGSDGGLDEADEDEADEDEADEDRIHPKSPDGF